MRMINEIPEAEVKEAKLKIATEFITKYQEWMKDLKEMDAKDFGWKYGIRFSEEFIQNLKDTQKTMLKFQSVVFNGRWLYAWERVGYEREMIWRLNRENFLSHDQYSNHRALASGKTDFYYLSQAKAKEIYKAYKNGFFSEK